jgi:hypothetical protein
MSESILLLINALNITISLKHLATQMYRNKLTASQIILAYARMTRKDVIGNEVKNPVSFKINKIDSSLHFRTAIFFYN